MPQNHVLVRHLGLQDYQTTYEAMRQFTSLRDEDTPDELWCVEHPQVYTLGLAGDPAHLLDPHTDIPMVQVDRGGQITFHGPGQCVVYLLFDLKHFQIHVKEFVYKIEESVIHVLQGYGILVERQEGAPGIYLTEGQEFGRYAGAKIAALGLKVTKHCTYHGLALNVNMNLSPFEAINPCGYPDLVTVDLATLGIVKSLSDVFQDTVLNLSKIFVFSYNEIE